MEPIKFMISFQLISIRYEHIMIRVKLKFFQNQGSIFPRRVVFFLFFLFFRKMKNVKILCVSKL